MNTEGIRTQAEGILENGKAKAAAILEDGGKMDQLLEQVEQKLETVPKAGEYLAEVPRMISLLKDHIQKDYTETPTSTLIMIVAALLYLVNPRDIIPDRYIGVGLLDDAAVITACIALTRKELDAYDAWKDAKAEAAKAEATEAPDAEKPETPGAETPEA